MHPLIKNVRISSIQCIVRSSLYLAFAMCVMTLSFAGVAVASEENLFTDLISDLTNGTSSVATYPVTFGITSGEGILNATADNDTIYSGSEMAEGSVIVFNATPSAGYQVEDWIVNNNSTGSAEPAYTISDHQAAVDVRVVFGILPVVSKPPQVDDIEILSAPARVAYTAGETLDLRGLEITLIRSDASTQDVAFENFADKGITVNPKNGTELREGDSQVTITHTASKETVLQAITVSPAPVTVDDLIISAAPYKESYTAGEALDLRGLVITLIRSDASTQDVPFDNFADNGITVSPENGTELREEDSQITITHTASGETIHQAITVNAVTITVTDLTIKTAPYKGSYTAGETLDLRGLEITLIRSDASTQDVAFDNFAVNGITVSPKNGTELREEDSQVVITHTDSGINVSQAITVNAAPVPVTGIQVAGSGNSIKVEEGKKLQMIATVLPADASNKKVKWSVTGMDGTATITQAGLLTGTGEGTVKVTATAADGSGITGTLNITVTKVQSTVTPTSGGGGGSGAGSRSTGESDDNIGLKDYSIKYIMKDTETLFEFRNDGNSILSIDFTTSLNHGQTKTVIEMLKGTSTLVKKAAPGVVYKNLNIWVGDGKVSPDMVSDARILFRVEKSWISENGIDPASVAMCRYDSRAWGLLPTSMTGEDDTYVYYLATTPGFSPFAISSVGEKERQALSVAAQQPSSPLEGEESAQMSTPDTQAPETGDAVSQPAQSAGSLIAFMFLAVVAALGILSYRHKEYLSEIRMQLGNPDGKRYRRFKKI